jgi:hypothetical protein
VEKLVERKRASSNWGGFVEQLSSGEIQWNPGNQKIFWRNMVNRLVKYGKPSGEIRETLW